MEYVIFFLVVIGGLLVIAGPLFYISRYAWYRSHETRHYHETETATHKTKNKKRDDFIKRESNIEDVLRWRAKRAYKESYKKNYLKEQENNS